MLHNDSTVTCCAYAKTPMVTQSKILQALPCILVCLHTLFRSETLCRLPHQRKIVFAKKVNEIPGFICPVTWLPAGCTAALCMKASGPAVGHTNSNPSHSCHETDFCKTHAAKDQQSDDSNDRQSGLGRKQAYHKGELPLKPKTVFSSPVWGMS